jgi:hypothetical protein
MLVGVAEAHTSASPRYGQNHGRSRRVMRRCTGGAVSAPGEPSSRKSQDRREVRLTGHRVKEPSASDQA